MLLCVIVANVVSALAAQSKTLIFHSNHIGEDQVLS
tara:strand:- start:189 stop:296 length:108 start_codon:yes stop_codon:yes gene_type:complete